MIGSPPNSGRAVRGAAFRSSLAPLSRTSTGRFRCWSLGRQILDLQAVVVLAPLAAVLDGLGDFLDGQVREIVQLLFGSRNAAEAAHVQSTAGFGRRHLVAKRPAAGHVRVLGRDVDKVALGRVAVLPELGVAGGVGEAFELAQWPRPSMAALYIRADDQVAQGSFSSGAGRACNIESHRHLSSLASSVIPPCVRSVNDLLEVGE